MTPKVTTTTDISYRVYIQRSKRHKPIFVMTTNDRNKAIAHANDWKKTYCYMGSIYELETTTTTKETLLTDI